MCYVTEILSSLEVMRMGERSWLFDDVSLHKVDNSLQDICSK
jgi:hypothetical protein